MAPTNTRLMYERWRDASPSKPFPFQYGDIKYTWADVRNGLARDMNKPSMIFNMGHITPGVMQAHIMKDIVRKEYVCRKRSEMIANRYRRSAKPSTTEASSRNSTANRETPLPPETTKSGETRNKLVVEPRSLSAAVSREHNRTQINAPQPNRLYSDEEYKLLYESEGGGRGRINYLRRRRALPPEIRYGIRVLTSHNLGWEVDRAHRLHDTHKALSTCDPEKAREVEREMQRIEACYRSTLAEGKDHRRRAGATAWLRPRGVNLGSQNYDPIRHGYVTFPPCK